MKKLNLDDLDSVAGRGSALTRTDGWRRARLRLGARSEGSVIDSCVTSPIEHAVAREPTHAAVMTTRRGRCGTAR